MPANFAARLQQFHVRLFADCFRDARALAVGESDRISQYECLLQRCLDADGEPAEICELREAMLSAQVVLCGDFHSHWSSQSAYLSLAQSVSATGREVILALEAFRHCDQAYLDAYLNDKLSETAFLDATDFSCTWGFPWPHYRMILDFARFNGLRVLGINSATIGASVTERDAIAADVIKKEASADTSVICLIGDLHLADEHLPHHLSRLGITDWLRVFINVDNIFFDKPVEHLMSNAKAHRLSRQTYCFNDGAPWFKWQTFVLWQENGISSFSDCTEPPAEAFEDDVGVQEWFDFDFYVTQFTRHLSSLFPSDAMIEIPVATLRRDRQRPGGGTSLFRRKTYRHHVRRLKVSYEKSDIFDLTRLATELFLCANIQLPPLNGPSSKAFLSRLLLESLTEIILQLVAPEVRYKARAQLSSVTASLSDLECGAPRIARLAIVDHNEHHRVCRALAQEVADSFLIKARQNLVEVAQLEQLFGRRLTREHQLLTTIRSLFVSDTHSLPKAV